MKNLLLGDRRGCDEKTYQTYFYVFLECPLEVTNYSVAWMVIIPDIIIMLEIVAIITIIWKIEQSLKKMVDPLFQQTYCIISFYIFRALQLNMIICLVSLSLRLIFISSGTKFNPVFMENGSSMHWLYGIYQVIYRMVHQSTEYIFVL